MNASFVEVGCRSLGLTGEIKVDRGTTIIVRMIIGETMIGSQLELYARSMEVHI